MEQNTSNSAPNPAPAVPHTRPYAAPPAGGKKPLPLKMIAIVLAAVILVAAASFALWKFSPFAGPVKKDQYQAVFLTNGQVYFGKLQNTTGQYLRLTDVYYLQATDAEQPAEQEGEAPKNQATQQLIKLGNEIHGPDDEMIVSRDQVLFFENIKNDGTVGQAIKKDKSDK